MNERAIILALILMPLVGSRLGCGEGAYADDDEESSPSPPELQRVHEPLRENDSH